jgi:hypothetical protein
MRNINRVLVMTLITSMTATSVVSTSAWAQESGIISETSSYAVERPVMVREVRREQRQAVSFVRDDSALYTCKAYAGMDRETLQSQLRELQLHHLASWSRTPEGGATIGAAIGGAIGIFKGVGSALKWAAGGGIIGAIGGLISWFTGGKSDDEREMVANYRHAKFDEERLQIRCMQNELEKREGYYASRVPGDESSSRYSSLRGEKLVAYNDSRSSSRYYDEDAGRARSGSSRYYDEDAYRSRSNSLSRNDDRNGGGDDGYRSSSTYENRTYSNASSAGGEPSRASSSCENDGGCGRSGLYDARDGRESESNYDRQPARTQEVERQYDSSSESRSRSVERPDVDCRT